MVQDVLNSQHAGHVGPQVEYILSPHNLLATLPEQEAGKYREAEGWERLPCPRHP